MKFTALALAALLPFTTFAAPTAAPAGDLLFDDTPSSSSSSLPLQKRAITGTVTADALKYRRCPRTSCDAVGQYSRGTHISINCYTDTDTTVVSGNPFWGKLTNGYWVSLYYVDWNGGIPHC